MNSTELAAALGDGWKAVDPDSPKHSAVAQRFPLTVLQMADTGRFVARFDNNIVKGSACEQMPSVAIAYALNAVRRQLRITEADLERASK